MTVVKKKNDLGSRALERPSFSQTAESIGVRNVILERTAKLLRKSLLCVMRSIVDGLLLRWESEGGGDDLEGALPTKVLRRRFVVSPDGIQAKKHTHSSVA